MIFLVQFGINKHSQIFQRLQIALALRARVIFCSLWKICSCLFIPNCTQNHLITHTNFLFNMFQLKASQKEDTDNLLFSPPMFQLYSCGVFLQILAFSSVDSLHAVKPQPENQVLFWLQTLISLNYSVRKNESHVLHLSLYHHMNPKVHSLTKIQSNVHRQLPSGVQRDQALFWTKHRRTFQRHSTTKFQFLCGFITLQLYSK